MNTYTVEVARPVNERGTLTIKANSIDEAEELAWSMANAGDLDDAEWDSYFSTENWGVVLSVNLEDGEEPPEDEEGPFDDEEEEQ